MLNISFPWLFSLVPICAILIFFIIFYKNGGCSIPQAAEACFVSESYLYYTFKKNLKIRPNDYRQKVLCEKAVSLLKTTDKKIDEIADCLDFSSASYLRKVLKKHIGKTPREIRKISGI